MTMLCPTCRHPLAEHEITVAMLPEFPFTPMERRILQELAAAYPKSRSIDRLVFAVYSDDVDGGPELADRVIHQLICRLRPRLLKYGWTIPSALGGRGNKGQYRLRPVEEKS